MSILRPLVPSRDRCLSWKKGKYKGKKVVRKWNGSSLFPRNGHLFLKSDYAKKELCVIINKNNGLTFHNFRTTEKSLGNKRVFCGKEWFLEIHVSNPFNLYINLKKHYPLIISFPVLLLLKDKLKHIKIARLYVSKYRFQLGKWLGPCTGRS